MNTTVALKVGDRIKVINIIQDRVYNGTVAALWPNDNAISVDVRKGKRIYFRSNVMGEWVLRDIVIRNDVQRANS